MRITPSGSRAVASQLVSHPLVRAVGSAGRSWPGSSRQQPAGMDPTPQSSKRPRQNGVMARAGPSDLRQGSTFAVSGLILTDHTMTVPLDHTGAQRGPWGTPRRPRRWRRRLHPAPTAALVNPLSSHGAHHHALIIPAQARRWGRSRSSFARWCSWPSGGRPPSPTCSSSRAAPASRRPAPQIAPAGSSTPPTTSGSCCW